jgi:hypothetical protein
VFSANPEADAAYTERESALVEHYDSRQVIGQPFFAVNASPKDGTNKHLQPSCCLPTLVDERPGREQVAGMIEITVRISSNLWSVVMESRCVHFPNARDPIGRIITRLRNHKPLHFAGAIVMLNFARRASNAEASSARQFHNALAIVPKK